MFHAPNWKTIGGMRGERARLLMQEQLNAVVALAIERRKEEDERASSKAPATALVQGALQRSKARVSERCARIR
jgi:hypothetical protein